jgi:MFS family permease
MMGLAEAYIVPFAVFLRVGTLQIGLLASVPLLCGALTQLWVAKRLDHAPSRRGYVLWLAVLQALALVLPVLLALVSVDHARKYLVLAAIPYFVLGSAAAPGWSAWMGDLLMPGMRGAFFGYRNKLRTLAQLGSLGLSGCVLSLGRHFHLELVGFLLIFALGASARLVSAWQISKMVEPRTAAPGAKEAFSLLSFVRQAPVRNFGRFTLYASLFFFATHISVPYFTPFMLEELKFSYAEYVMAAAMYTLVEGVMMHNWGRVCDRVGSRKVLAYTGMLLPFVPLLWLPAHTVWPVLLIQAISGLLWGGFHIAAANFLFDAVTPLHRARCMAYYTVLTTIGVTLGAVLGGWLAKHLPTRYVIFGLQVEFSSVLLVIFCISGAARLLASLGMLPLLREAREVPRASARDVIVQLFGQSFFNAPRVSLLLAGQAEESSKSRASKGKSDEGP